MVSYIIHNERALESGIVSLKMAISYIVTHNIGAVGRKTNGSSAYHLTRIYFKSRIAMAIKDKEDSIKKRENWNENMIFIGPGYSKKR